MQTKIQVGQTRNLYEYWCDVVEDYLNQYRIEKEEIYINLASNEYSRVIQYLSKKKKLVTCIFKVQRDDSFKVESTAAKKVWGLMVQYIVKNKLTRVENLKEF